MSGIRRHTQRHPGCPLISIGMELHEETGIGCVTSVVRVVGSWAVRGQAPSARNRRLREDIRDPGIRAHERHSHGVQPYASAAIHHSRSSAPSW